MSINQLIFRSLKKNIKNYYLYVFALIFSVALYFSFVTLQYDPAMDATKGSIKGGAAIRTASILLIAIVAIFLFYANNIFIKRRSKEIGLFQLIGMTKGKIFCIISTENIMLYFGSLTIGTFIGFAVSKLIKLILFKITGIDQVASLTFSGQALAQTVLVFAAVYLFIMLMNYLFIKRQTILSLFSVASSSEERVKKVSVWEMIFGIFGLLLIAVGYYLSSKLFDGDFSEMTELFAVMIAILASVIIGTYLFYKGSVTFVSNLIRKKKNGYLSINEVLSLSSIMFRMKTNAMLLTIITTISALAISLLALSYISYYSAEKSAADNVPAHFSFTNTKDANMFKDALAEKNIDYQETTIPVLQANVDISKLLASSPKGLNFDPNVTALAVVSDKNIKGVNVKANETLFTGYNDALAKFMPLKSSGAVTLKTNKESISLHYIGLDSPTIVPYIFTSGGMPTVIVDETIFSKLVKSPEKTIQRVTSLYIGMDIKDKTNIKKANTLFARLDFQDKDLNISRLDMIDSNKSNMGLTMFIVGFLGLTFLITSGCILYFKQMGEGEEEKFNYTILRKLGFTQGDLLKGIQGKQLFNFGIPLIVGLLHSYFAVQSGWFFFGTELWTPMVIVMVLYTILYSIFGVLSVFYYKKLIHAAL
ncbi:ABC transporter permease [Niallia nealsonii]|uniref:Bacitracin ABC transporter permease n=1 Tax=Niallia nealsonii TaxID=115979 RepID=A0A2N0Z1R1_9BACI|nr:ABC transporter permease [Niallia nealsonii]PKG23450.1 bacitracin ABC transporter permease [Niallia nealsonii]